MLCKTAVDACCGGQQARDKVGCQHELEESDIIIVIIIIIYCY